MKRERPELLKPIELFGTAKGYRELDAGAAAAMHKKWSPRIAPAARGIHAYWLARRLDRRPIGASEPSSSKYRQNFSRTVTRAP